MAFFTAEILNLDRIVFKGHCGVRIPGYEFHYHLRGDPFFLGGGKVAKKLPRQIYSPLCKETKVGMEIIQPGSIGDILYLGPSRKIFQQKNAVSFRSFTFWKFCKLWWSKSEAKQQQQQHQLLLRVPLLQQCYNIFII